MRNKGFSPILIVLIVAVLGIVGYFYYKNIQKPSDTFVPVLSPTSFPDTYINWKEYDLGEITFKLPSGWVENEKGENEIYFNNNNQTISIHKEVTNLNLEDYFNKGKEDTKYLRGGNLGIWIEKRIIVDNQPVVKVETANTDDQSKGLVVYTTKTVKGDVGIVITVDNSFEKINEWQVVPNWSAEKGRLSEII